MKERLMDLINSQDKIRKEVINLKYELLKIESEMDSIETQKNKVVSTDITLKNEIMRKAKFAEMLQADLRYNELINQSLDIKQKIDNLEREIYTIGLTYEVELIEFSRGVINGNK